jgi:hypothetical protein
MIIRRNLSNSRRLRKKIKSVGGEIITLLNKAIYRPSRGASMTLRLHLSPNEARLGLIEETLKLPGLGKVHI